MKDNSKPKPKENNTLPPPKMGNEFIKYIDTQEIISMLMDCRNIIDRCESVTIGKTQLNIKVIEVNNLIQKLIEIENEK